jgi:peptide/nickel transport system permease protein
MTDAVAPTPTAVVATVSRPRRTYFQMVVRDTIRRTGAKVGMAWLLVVTFCAVFAPLLATSHPLVMKAAGGELSFPVLNHLKPVDVTLLVMAPVVLLLLMLPRPSQRLRLTAFFGALAVTWVLSVVFVKPPSLVVLDQYREMDAAGEIEWAIHAPIRFSPTDRLRDQRDTRRRPPNREHLLGTDINSADVASAMIHASRIALAVGLIATSIALFIGIVIGGLMGYFGRWVDLLGFRLVEIFAAIPVLYLLLTFAAFFPGNPEILPGVEVPRIYLMMVIIGVTGWVGYARFVRAEFFKLRKQDFVQAARACGLPLRSIMFKHMLPNGVAPVLVEASFGVAAAILFEAFLSFLGLGLVDEPSWGQLLSQAIGVGGGFYWWIATFPGLAIFLTVFALNLVGESMRDAIDPHTKRVAA